MNFKENIVEYENYDNDSYELLKLGNVPVLITAVHTMVQNKQDGSVKLNEPLTKAIAMYCSNNSDCYYYIKNKDTGIDSNSLIDDDFKNKLIKIINENNIKLVIDIHGANYYRDFDVEFGNLNNLSTDYSTIMELKESFLEEGILNINVNNPFKGGGITQKVYGNTMVDVVQIEINKKYRDINNIENIEKICNAIIKFILQYSKYI